MNSVNIQHTSAILVANVALRGAFEAAQAAAIAANTFTQGRAVARSQARTRVMDLAHGLLAEQGLGLASGVRLESERFMDFLSYGKESFEDFCGAVAEEAENQFEAGRQCASSGHSFMGPHDEHCSNCGDWVGPIEI